MLQLKGYRPDQNLILWLKLDTENERRLKSRIEAVFDAGVQHLTYHAVMSAEHPLPPGNDALFYIEQVARGTGAKCIVVDTVQSILNPSANNKNYDQTMKE